MSDLRIPLTTAQLQRLRHLQQNVVTSVGMRDNAFAVLLEGQLPGPLEGYSFDLQEGYLVARPPASSPASSSSSSSSAPPDSSSSSPVSVTQEPDSSSSAAPPAP